jgi:nitrite reductase (NADH) large subunit
VSTLRVVIIGAGLSGVSVASALLERAPAGKLKIDVLEREPRGNCDRFELLRALRGEMTPEQLLRPAPAWFTDRGIDYHPGAEVHLVDRVRRRVYSDGLSLPYDKLIFANRSSPYLPSIQGLVQSDGSLHRGVFKLHTLQDVEALGGATRWARRVAVLGGGPVGLEIAEALARRGVEVHVFHTGQRLMNGQLDEAAAGFLKTKLTASGVQLHFGARVTALRGDQTLTGMQLSDGALFDCDAVVLAAGLQPNTWLAFQCGLSVERGIEVEGRMRSLDDFDVHALGECAQWRGSIQALPQQIAEQAQVIAEHLTTRHSQRRYLGSRGGAFYQVLGLNLSTLGSPEARDTDDVVQLGEPSRNRYKKVVLREGRVVSAILLGDIRQAGNLAELYASNARLTREAQHQLFALSMPSGARLSQPPPEPEPRKLG